MIFRIDANFTGYIMRYITNNIGGIFIMMNKDVSKKLVKNAICELCDYEEYDNAMTKEQRLDILHKAKEINGIDVIEFE